MLSYSTDASMPHTALDTLDVGLRLLKAELP
jgi:hypothetical protein